MTDSSTPASPPDWESIARHIAGEGDPRVASWLADHPDEARLVASLSDVAGRIPAMPVEGLDVEGALRRTRERMRETPVVALESRRVSRRPWIAVAAAAAVVAAVALGRSYRPVQSDAAADVVYTGRAGQVDSVQLSDGSLALIAPGTELTVPGSFQGEGERRLRLRGRAWFRAVHDDKRPFLVETDGAIVRDIGTEFSVVPLADGTVQVAVHEGSVAVRPSGGANETTVVAGDGVTVRADSVVSGAAGAADAGWLSGRLRFADVSLGEFAATVSRWTGWTVTVDEALAGLRVTTELELARARTQFEDAALSVGGRVVWAGDSARVTRR